MIARFEWVRYGLPLLMFGAVACGESEDDASDAAQDVSVGNSARDAAQDVSVGDSARGDSGAESSVVWQVAGYEGALTPPGYRYITDAPTSQIRNDVYLQDGEFDRAKCSPEEPSEDCDAQRPVSYRPHAEDPRFADQRVLEVRVDLARAQDLGLEPYRAQVQFASNRFASAYPDVPVQEGAWGWDNWETAVGYELFVRFSLRIPDYNRVPWPPATPAGLDYPHFVANIFQIRHRFHDPPRNIPLHLDWKYDHILLQSAWFDDAVRVAETPRERWIDFLILAQCSLEESGAGFEIWVRAANDERFELRHAYQGPFYGTTEPGTVDVARENLGFPSYGIYTSTRLVGEGLADVIAAGVSEVGIEFSHIEVAQVPAGSVQWSRVVEETERDWTRP